MSKRSRGGGERRHLTSVPQRAIYTYALTRCEACGAPPPLVRAATRVRTPFVPEVGPVTRSSCPVRARGWIRMGERVEAVVRRAGGTVPEDQVVTQLANVHGLRWARDAVSYALRDGRVFRRYLDGKDGLHVPDERGAPR